MPRNLFDGLPIILKRRTGASKRILQVTSKLLVALLSAGALAAAQRTPAPKAPSNTGSQAPIATFRLQSTLVTTPVLVTDSRGNPVFDLSKSDFVVMDNGKQQQISRLDLTPSPLAVVIVVQTTDSLAPLLPNLKRLAPLFSSLMTGTKGKTAVIFFDSTVRRVQPFSPSGSLLRKTFEGIKAEGSGARLNDALAQAIDLLRDRPSTDTKVIVVVGTGFDSGSRTTKADVLRAASGVEIYGLGISATEALLKTKPHEDVEPGGDSIDMGPPIPGMPSTPDLSRRMNAQPVPMGAIVSTASKAVRSKFRRNRLELYARFTGGAFFPQWSAKVLQAHLDRLALDVDSQFQLAYVPNDLDQTGYHRIIVRVEKPGLRVRARQGYFYYTPSGRR